MNKNKELLAELSESNGKLKEAIGKSNALEDMNKTYANEITRRIISDTYNTSNNKLMDGTQEIVRRMLFINAESNNGLNLKVNDDKSISLEDTSGKTFQNYFDEWTTTEQAKAYIKNHCSGAGTSSSENFGVGSLSAFSGLSRESLERMTPQQVADNLDNPSFKSNINTLLN